MAFVIGDSLFVYLIINSRNNNFRLTNNESPKNKKACNLFPCHQCIRVKTQNAGILYSGFYFG